MSNWSFRFLFFFFVFFSGLSAILWPFWCGVGRTLLQLLLGGAQLDALFKVFVGHRLLNVVQNLARAARVSRRASIAADRTHKKKEKKAKRRKKKRQREKSLGAGARAGAGGRARHVPSETCDT